MLDERTITRAIIDRYFGRLTSCLDLDVAVCGAGPSGLVAAYFLAKENLSVAVFERKLSLGGGMWGGGMMFNEIVVQEEAKPLMDELGVRTTQYAPGYITASSVETTAALCLACARAGAQIFNLIGVEDLMVREDRVCGIVINWTAVEQTGLHVDPLTVSAKAVVDATGHEAEIVRTFTRKMGACLAVPGGERHGEKSLWAEVAEKTTLDNTRCVYPGLWVAGMAANATFGSYRMGPVFGGMLLSGRRVAELIAAELRANQ